MIDVDFKMFKKKLCYGFKKKLLLNIRNKDNIVSMSVHNQKCYVNFDNNHN